MGLSSATSSHMSGSFAIVMHLVLLVEMFILSWWRSEELKELSLGVVFRFSNYCCIVPIILLPISYPRFKDFAFFIILSIGRLNKELGLSPCPIPPGVGMFSVNLSPALTSAALLVFRLWIALVVLAGVRSMMQIYAGVELRSLFFYLFHYEYCIILILPLWNPVVLRYSWLVSSLTSRMLMNSFIVEFKRVIPPQLCG